MDSISYWDPTAGNVDQLQGNGVVDRKDGDSDIKIEQDIDIFLRHNQNR